MGNKKALIICQYVHHANTLKIAKVIAKVLEAEIKKPSEINIEKINKYDLIGFGSGIYWGKHHFDLLKLVDKLTKLKNKKVFIFSTSGMSNVGNFLHNIRYLASHFHVPLRRKLKRKGVVIIGEFSCRGFDTAGPLKKIGGISKNRPNQQDIQKAKHFAQKLKISL